MHIARVERNGSTRWGFVEGDHVVLSPTSTPGLEGSLSLGLEHLAELRDKASERVSLDEIRFLAPVPQPTQFLGVGLNYIDHATEAGLEPPQYPQVFGLLSSAVIGPDEKIVLPKCSNEVDWEVELAIVIGKRGTKIRLEDALDHVAGYTIVHDVSARDIQTLDGQFTRAKSFDTFKPMGPWITTVDELGAAEDVDVQLSVNGVVKQSSNTSNLIFDVRQLIHLLSQDITLQPGAVISTGTPAGVGFTREPAEFLRPDDVVSLEIGGIGTLTNSVVSPN